MRATSPLDEAEAALRGLAAGPGEAFPRAADASRTVILDLDFGGGLAFLALRRAWLRDAPPAARLHHAALLDEPLPARALAARLDALGVEADDYAALAERWPPAAEGVHRLALDGGRVVLTLAVGPTRRTLPRLVPRADAVIVRTDPAGATVPDAAALRTAAASLAHGGVLALAAVPDRSDPPRPVRCGADDVRRALESAGLRLERLPGPAGSARGVRVRGPSPSADAPGSREAIVVGAGLAGAAVSAALARRGWRVARLGGGPVPGSMQPALAQHPSVTPDDAPLSRLTRAALLLSRGVWRDDLPPPCGRVQRMPAARAAAVSRGLPEDWVRAVDAREAGERAGIGLREGGLWLPLAGTASPADLLRAWTVPGVTPLDAMPVDALRSDGDGWRATGPGGATLARAPVAVLAAGAADPSISVDGGAPQRLSERVAAAGLQRRADRTTVAHAPAGARPACIVGGDGHALPLDDGRTLLGPAPSDVDRPHDAPLDEADSRRAWARWAAQLAAPVPEPPLEPGPSGTRLSTRDHLPLAGRVPAWTRDAGAHALPGLWTATAFGGRGLLWAVLAAELVASALEAEPSPLERALVDALDPARFTARRTSRP